VNKPVKVIKIEKPLTCLQEIQDCVWCGSLDGVIRIYDKVVCRRGKGEKKKGKGEKGKKGKKGKREKGKKGKREKGKKGKKEKRKKGKKEKRKNGGWNKNMTISYSYYRNSKLGRHWEGVKEVCRLLAVSLLQRRIGYGWVLKSVYGLWIPR
jgi:hypothetical protein